MRILCYLAMLIAFCPAQLRAESAPVQETASNSEGEISWWVGELDSNLYDTRERAQKRLADAGLAALPAVSEAAHRGTLESSTRAINILLAWSESKDKDLSVAALEKLAELKDRPKEADLAKRLLSEVRENVALEKLEKLGATYLIGAQINGVVGLRTERSVQVVIGADWKGGVKGLKHLKHVPHTTLLCFHSPPIGEEALAVLDDLPELKRLELYGTRISPETIAKTKEKLPMVQVEVRSGAFLGVRGTFGDHAHVGEVVPGSAADKAGIKQNDVITKLNGEEVKDFVTLTGMIAQHQPGDSVMLTIVRPTPNQDPEIFDVKVTFAQWGIDGAGGVVQQNGEQSPNGEPDVGVNQLQLDRR